MSFFIKEFAVVPGYQSKGIGKQIIESIEGKSHYGSLDAGTE